MVDEGKTRLCQRICMDKEYGISYPHVKAKNR